MNRYVCLTLLNRYVVQIRTQTCETRSPTAYISWITRNQWTCSQTGMIEGYISMYRHRTNSISNNRSKQALFLWGQKQKESRHLPPVSPITNELNKIVRFKVPIPVYILDISGKWPIGTYAFFLLNKKNGDMGGDPSNTDVGLLRTYVIWYHNLMTLPTKPVGTSIIGYVVHQLTQSKQCLRTWKPNVLCWCDKCIKSTS